MGFLFEHGLGVPEDPEMSRNWYRKAAGHGRVSSQFSLGMLFNVGEPVSYDYVEAVARTRTAAEQGVIKAQKDLGLAYAIGQGVHQDYAQAAIWYRKAANHGDAEAQFDLGLFYLDESIFPAGTAEGISWLAKAAEQGFDEAQFELGLLYSREEKAFKRTPQKLSSGSNSLLPESRTMEKGLLKLGMWLRRNCRLPSLSMLKSGSIDGLNSIRRSKTEMRGNTDGICHGVKMYDR